MSTDTPAQPLQGGLSNAELIDAWGNKLPGVIPADRELTSFALGIEVGQEHARNLERQDWSRVHHVLAKHGVHPGRTDDHLADVIDRALAASPQPTAAQPLTDEQIKEITLAVVYGGDESTPYRDAWAAEIGIPFARAVERAHGIGASAAPAQAAQEPKNAHNDDPAYSANQVAGLLADVHAAYGHSQQQFVDSQAAVAELVEALNNLLEAVESMQGTYGCVRGDTPEDADTFTHDEWAEKFLQERANAAGAALSRAPGAGMPNDRIQPGAVAPRLE